MTIAPYDDVLAADILAIQATAQQAVAAAAAASAAAAAALQGSAAAYELLVGINSQSAAPLANGDAGYVLISNGGTAAPSFQPFSGSSFTFNQGTPEATWTITHNLDRFPSVTIVDSANNVVEGDITYLSTAEIQVSFASAFSGTAYLN